MWTPDNYVKALLFAAKAHGDQKSPGDAYAYIAHPCAVTAEVIAALRAEPHHDQTLAIQCALLHDVIEDTEVGYEQVLAAFGPAVADGVLALSKNPDLPTKAQQMADSLGRIRQQPHAVWMVKLADRIMNLMEPPHYWDRARRAAYQEEGRQIYAALHEASPTLAGRLLQRIEEYSAYIG